MKRLKNILRFFKTRLFLYNLGAAVLVLIVFFFGMNWWLKSFTKFGAEHYVTVPDLRGLPAEQVSKRLAALELKFEVTDSVFNDAGEKGTVWLQQPEPTSVTKQKVKKGRTIFLSVIAKAPKMISMPKLKDKSRRHAEGILRIIGLKAIPKYKAYSDCNDCVIEQQYKGKIIEPGQRIPRGETIVLILGRKSSESADVPDLMGLTIEQAQERLSETSLLLFVRECDCPSKRDSLRAVVTSQLPAAGASISAGSEISVWLK
ncbi:MAG: PASTA domain-containing protein [Flavobacteriales bacterium]